MINYDYPVFFKKIKNIDEKMAYAQVFQDTENGVEDCTLDVCSLLSRKGMHGHFTQEGVGYAIIVSQVTTAKDIKRVLGICANSMGKKAPMILPLSALTSYKENK